MKPKLFLTIFWITFLLSKISFSQASLTACCDTVICTPGAAVTLTATAPPNLTTVVLPVDDEYGPVVPLGFTFNFFGKNYSYCIISTNDYITFDTINNQPGSFSPYSISAANPSPLNPTNCIFGPWEDIDPSPNCPIQGTMISGTFGTAPNRCFVLEFCQMPFFDCCDTLFSGQIVLYETTNKIRVNINSKPMCTLWLNGEALEGIVDSSGTNGFTVPGRNYPTQWRAYSDSYEFTPTSATNYTIAQVPFSTVGITGAIQWEDIQGNVLATGNSFTVHPTLTTKYIATNSATSCTTNGLRDTITVLIRKIPVNISVGDASCKNADNGSITVTPTNPMLYNFTWTDSIHNPLKSTVGAFSDGLQNIIPTNSIYVLITDTSHCSTLDTIRVSFNGSMQANFSVSPTIHCNDSVLHFTNTTVLNNVQMFAAHWNFGDDDSSNILTIAKHDFTTPGIYQVKLIVHGTAGCIDSITLPIDVLPNIHAGFAVLPSKQICANQSIFLQDSSTQFPIQWQWNFGNGNHGSGKNVSEIYADSGNYSITLFVKDSLCGSSFAGTTIHVVPIPTPYIGPDMTICQHQTIVLSANYQGIYLWSDSERTETITIAPFAPSTIYKVQVEDRGCVSKSEIEIKTEQCAVVFPNAFSPNNDGIDDLFYPNLTSDLVHLVDFTIFDRWGEVVYSSTNNDKAAWNGTFNSKLSPIGVYYYTCHYTDIQHQTLFLKGDVTLLR